MRRIAQTGFFSVCLVFAMLASDIASADSQSDDITLSLLVRVAKSDPLSCARADQNLTTTTACLGDVGGYQIARLGLAIDAMAGALLAAGLGGHPEEIQQSLLTDVLAFGPRPALTYPAMNLIDAASVPTSPFGDASKKVAGMSIVSLEYLYSGIIPQMKLDYERVAAMSGLQLHAGPRTFSDYILGPSRTPMKMMDYQVFSPASVDGPILQKAVVKMNLPAGVANAAADFFLPDPSLSTETRDAPVGLVFGELAAISASFGFPLYDGVPVKPGLEHGLEGAPFGGMSCLMCGGDVKQVYDVQKGKSLLGMAPSFGGLLQDIRSESATEVRSIKHSGYLDGLDMMQETRSARLSTSESVTPEKSDAGKVDQQSENETWKFAKKIATKVAKKAIVPAVGALIGGKVGEFLTKKGGSARGAALGIFFSPSKIACGKGEWCPGTKTEEQYNKEVEEIKEELKEKQKAEAGESPPPKKNNDDGDHETGKNGNDGKKKPEPNKAVEGDTKAGSLADTKYFPQTDWDSPGIRNIPEGRQCRKKPEDQECACAVNEAGIMGICIPLNAAEVLFDAAGSNSPGGWLIVNHDMASERQILSLKIVVRPEDDPESVPKFDWVREMFDAPPKTFTGSIKDVGKMIPDEGLVPRGETIPEWARHILSGPEQPRQVTTDPPTISLPNDIAKISITQEASRLR